MQTENELIFEQMQVLERKRRSEDKPPRGLLSSPKRNLMNEIKMTEDIALSAEKGNVPIQEPLLPHNGKPIRTNVDLETKEFLLNRTPNSSPSKLQRNVHWKEGNDEEAKVKTNTLVNDYSLKYDYEDKAMDKIDSAIEINVLKQSSDFEKRVLLRPEDIDEPEISSVSITIDDEDDKLLNNVLTSVTEDDLDAYIMTARRCHKSRDNYSELEYDGVYDNLPSKVVSKLVKFIGKFGNSFRSRQDSDRSFELSRPPSPHKSIGRKIESPRLYSSDSPTRKYSSELPIAYDPKDSPSRNHSTRKNQSESPLRDHTYRPTLPITKPPSSQVAISTARSSLRSSFDNADACGSISQSTMRPSNSHLARQRPLNSNNYEGGCACPIQ